jgi:hypothetical protein
MAGPASSRPAAAGEPHRVRADQHRPAVSHLKTQDEPSQTGGPARRVDGGDDARGVEGMLEGLAQLR